MLEAGGWLCKLDRITFVQIHIRFASCGADANSSFGAHRLPLRGQIHYADFTRFNLVNLFNGTGDMRLGSALWHIKCVHTPLGQDQSLLGEPRRADDVVRHSVFTHDSTRGMLSGPCLLLLLATYFFCSKECHILFFSTRREQLERNFRIFYDEILVREHINRIEASHLFCRHIPEVTETLRCIFIIRRECDKSSILFLRDKFRRTSTLRQFLNHSLCIRSFRFSKRKCVNENNLAILRLTRQYREECAYPHLLVYLFTVVASIAWAECYTTVTPYRRASGAVTRLASPFLAPWLLTATRHLRAVLSVSTILTQVRLHRCSHLVHQVTSPLHTKDARRERNCPDILPVH